MNRTTVAALLAAGLLSAAVAVGKTSPAGESQTVRDLAVGIPHDAFFGLSVDPQRSVAVGVGAAISQSIDGGATWERIDHGQSDLALFAVDRGGGHTVAVGQMGLVMIEESPGKWIKVDAGFEGRMLSVSVNQSGLAFIGAEFGNVLKSEDGGRTWTSSPPPWTDFEDKETFGTAEPHVYAVHVSENGEITLAGEFGVILRSYDRGQTWTVLKQLKAGEPTIFAMHIADQGKGNSYAVGLEGEILTSPDGGRTWLRCKTNVSAPFLGVAATADGHAVVSGMRVMLRSSNSGITWEQVREGDITTDWYQSVDVHEPSGRILAVGHSGKIIEVGAGS